MSFPSPHTFHIPVMGLAFTVDSPIKVARFGISSVVSIIDDHLLEEMRKYYCMHYNEEYLPIRQEDAHFRAARISAYLNFLATTVEKQMKKLVQEEFLEGSDIVKYFELLPSNSSSRLLFEKMKSLEAGPKKENLQSELRTMVVAGAIDVNIMTKCDKTNFAKSGEALPPEEADAMSALRGFAESSLDSSIVFSAGMNPRLFSYCETFPDFFPNAEGQLKKQIILKVSDFRSAMIQGKFLAKKGLWVSEFRIESGLNCGGHAFATEGYLLGPILEEFKEKKEELAAEMCAICNAVLLQKGATNLVLDSHLKISVQGGIGTSNEQEFLRNYYGVDSVGWGSPFLLVPEATTVDSETLQQLATADPKDYYLSNASPLGVPFNNFRKSSAEAERKLRISKARPGSPCYNKFLAFDTEFTAKPICLASREYQNLKIKQLQGENLSAEILEAKIAEVEEKECICNGLATPAFLSKGLHPPHKMKAVSICPGPNLAFFSNIHSLRQMVDHIYGRGNVLNQLDRPSMFVNELVLYVDYLKKEISNCLPSPTSKQQGYLKRFKENLYSGIAYCRDLGTKMSAETAQYRANFAEQLLKMEQSLDTMTWPVALSMNGKMVL